MICAWVITIGCYRVDPGVSPNTARLLPKSCRTLRSSTFSRYIGKCLGPLIATKPKSKVTLETFCVRCKYPGGKDGHGSGEDFMESNICRTLTPETKYKKIQNTKKIQNKKNTKIQKKYKKTRRILWRAICV